jgi:Mlc titration factor MtfA (ptsG expression regulator)
MIGLFDWLRGRDSPAISSRRPVARNTVMSLPFLEVLAVDERVQLKALAEAFLAEKEFSAPAAWN